MNPGDSSSIGSFLDAQRDKPTLRFITCGSVDDGKSTLIGRLLHESKSLFDDQLKALESESKQYGTQGEKLDMALLVDGLQAEREQGITIDVAYRFFSTERRRYVVADTPGHEQYTRNMATGASTADVAIILIDARKGVLTQTMRHSRIVSMMGIRDVVLAVNKMDLVAFDEAVFARIVESYRAATTEFGFRTVQAIPLSALAGDNLIARSDQAPWYTGPTLLEHLEALPVGALSRDLPFRLSVQWVNRPNLDFRGFCGRIAQGVVRPGDAVRVVPSGVETKVARIVSFDGDRPEAVVGDSVTLTLEDEVDLSRGDVLAAVADRPVVADQFVARLLWMAEAPVVPGRAYFLKVHNQEVSATLSRIEHRVDVNTGEHVPATSLALNEIGVVHVTASKPIVFEAYAVNRTLGGFILVDKLTFETVGAGMIDSAQRRASNIHWQALHVDKARRSEIKGQQARCVWFTGLSGSGKSTIANLLEKRLHADGRHTYVLDGDNVRHGLNRDLGFTEVDRVENLRRITEVSRLMVDAGLIVLVSFISPFREERRKAREGFDAPEFLEVFVDTPLDVCEQRDPKGLYAKARGGSLKNFTGIDSPYEAPEAAEVRLDTRASSPEACVEAVMKALTRA